MRGNCKHCNAHNVELSFGACKRCNFELRRDFEREQATREREQRQWSKNQREAAAERKARSEETAVRQQLQKESHLNAIKLMLLDHAARGTSDPDSAIASLLVIMRAKDFQANIDWFWDDIASNPLLMDAYVSETLGALTSGAVDAGSAVKYFDKIPAIARNDLRQWFARQSPQSLWHRCVAPLLKHYEEVEESRRREHQRIETERKKRIEEEEHRKREIEAEETRRLHREAERREQSARDDKRNRKRRFELIAISIVISSAVIGAIVAGLSSAENPLYIWLFIQLIGMGIGGHMLKTKFPEQFK